LLQSQSAKHLLRAELKCSLGLGFADTNRKGLSRIDHCQLRDLSIFEPRSFQDRHKLLEQGRVASEIDLSRWRLNHCISIVIVNALEVFRFDFEPTDISLIPRPRSDIANEVFDEHRMIVSCLSNEFFIGSL
jgi:hypothetical protein